MFIGLHCMQASYSSRHNPPETSDKDVSEAAFSTLSDSISASGVSAAPPIGREDLNSILESTEPLWGELRGRSIFLTGGTGFFGCWLLESFLAANDAFDLRAQATVLTRSRERFRRRAPHLAGHRAIRVVEGDIRDFQFPSGEFPFVIHAATDSVPRQTDDELTDLLSTIVEGTRRCLEFAETHGTKKFLLTSSGAVYGVQPSTVTHMTEEFGGAPDPCDAKSVYGEGKRMAELLCALSAAQSGMECKIARCFAFVGPHLPLDAHFAIGNFIRDALNGGPIQIQGNGTPMRSYLYAADLAIWLWTILLRGPSMRPFNVGSEQDRNIRAVAEAVVCALQANIEIQAARQDIPGAPVSRYVPSVRRAKEELDLTESIALEDAIRRTAAWVRTQRNP